MIRLVLDANVIVSAMPARSGALAALIDCWRAKRFELVVSEHILAEVSRTWRKPYWNKRFTQSQIARALELLNADAVMILISVDVLGVATHPEDDLILATAVSAEADFLVTGDKQLLAIRSYRNVEIIEPWKLAELCAFNTFDE